MNIKKGDKVKVLTGKDKGKTGTVLRALPKEEKVVVEGIAVAKRHTKSRVPGQSGSIAEGPRPIHVSNVSKVS
jgi:large subunit ribosomal protein L24